MSKCDLRIMFDRKDRTYHGGETVTGKIHIRVNEAVRSNGITLTHQWRTHGRGNTTSGPREKLQLASEDTYSPGEEVQVPFSVIAANHPVTYRGNLINIDHYVSVQVDVPWAFNPKAEEEYLVKPGEPPTARIQFHPRKQFRINGIGLTLLGKESATSGSGTNSTTHSHTILEQKLVVRSNEMLAANEPVSEEFTFAFPSTEAFSLDVSDNKIQWTATVRIDIPAFPDWTKAQPIQVVPASFLSNVSDAPAPTSAESGSAAGRSTRRNHRTTRSMTCAAAMSGRHRSRSSTGTAFTIASTRAKWMTTRELILFQGSCPGTHCSGGSCLLRAKHSRQEPAGQCVPRLEPRNEISQSLNSALTSRTSRLPVQARAQQLWSQIPPPFCSWNPQPQRT